MKIRNECAAAEIAGAADPVIRAEARLAVNGARPTREPINTILGGLTPADYAELTPKIGANWLPGTSATVVDYPATVGPLWGFGAPDGDRAIAAGRANLHAAIMTAVAGGDAVVVTGLSMGTMVIEQELAHLATATDAPPTGRLKFVLFACPSRGLASVPAPGIRIPFVGYTPRPIPESQYDRTVVFTRYDGWADFPDRSWNLLAVANAVMSFLGRDDRLHTPTALADPSRAVVVSNTTNARGGTTTTYMIPTANLPLTDPLRRIGVPKFVTDQVDKVLRPVVDAGYSRNEIGHLQALVLSQRRLLDLAKAAVSSLSRRRSE